MAEDQTEAPEGYWLDLNVPRRVHRKLTVWGKRLGLTAEGYAKLLIYQGMHGLLAEEQLHEAKRASWSKRPDVSRDTAAPGKNWLDHGINDGRPPSPEQELTLEMWFGLLKHYIQTPDLLPAPRQVVRGWRQHHANDFRWPEDRRPPIDLVWWDGVRLALGKSPPADPV